MNPREASLDGSEMPCANHPYGNTLKLDSQQCKQCRQILIYMIQQYTRSMYDIYIHTDLQYCMQPSTLFTYTALARLPSRNARTYYTRELCVTTPRSYVHGRNQLHYYTYTQISWSRCIYRAGTQSTRNTHRNCVQLYKATQDQENELKQDGKISLVDSFENWKTLKEVGVCYTAVEVAQAQVSQITFITDSTTVRMLMAQLQALWARPVTLVRPYK